MADDPYATSSLPTGSFAGLSLWLQVDDSSTQSGLRHVMDALRSHVGQEEAPSFEPHATLLAGLTPEQGWQPETIWDGVQKAVQTWRRETSGPLAVPFSSVMTKGMFFQCVLIELHKEASLMALNEHMRAAFGKEGQPPYFPHISLLYADIGRDRAGAQIEWAREQGLWSATDHGVQVGPKSLSAATFSTLSLWDTNGPVSQWKKLKEMSLD